MRLFSSFVQRGKCKCVDRGGAGAGGEATLAVQGLPAGAERVPAEATQASQVALHSHVTSHHLDEVVRERTEMSRGERDERRTRKLLEETVEKRLHLLGVMAALTVSLSLSPSERLCRPLFTA